MTSTTTNRTALDGHTALELQRSWRPLLIAVSLLLIAALIGCGGGGSRVGSSLANGSKSGSSTPVSLTAIHVSPTSPSIAVGASQSFSATGAYSDGTSRDLTSSVTWSSSAPSVATIANGIASAVAAGNATISAASGSVSGSASLTVTGSQSSQPTLTSIAITPASATIAQSATQQFTATGTYSDNSQQDLTASATWNSSASAVASVSASGVVTGVAAGMAEIAANVGSVSGSAAITVTAPAASLSSLSVSPATATLDVGATAQLHVTGLYSDNSTQDLTSSATWASLASGVATVSSSGVVSGVAAGTANITVSVGSLSGSAAITVTAPAASLSSLSVSPATATLDVGTTAQLHVTGVYSDNSTQDLTSSVTWASSASGVATVSNSGIVSGIAAGTANVTATSGGLSSSVSVTVNARSLVSISVTAPALTVPIGATLQFTATGQFSDGSSQDLTNAVAWSASSAAATIDNAGLATGKSSGTVTISAASANVTGSASLTVSTAILASLSVSPDPTSLPGGGTVQFVATGTFTDGTTQDLTNVTWSSSSTGVATIDSSGIATGIATGTTTITGSVGAISDTATLNVLPATLVSIAVSAPQSTIAAGTSEQFTATGTFSDGSTQALVGVSWNSSNSSVATISSSGMANASGGGTTAITATLGSVSGSMNLTVTTATLTSIIVTPAVPQLAVGVTKQFTATGLFSDGTTQDLTSSVAWNSSVATVASISNSGLATALSAGSTTISATVGSVNGSTSVNVISVTLVSLAIVPPSMTIATGTTQQYTLVGTFSDGSTQPLTATAWRSSKPSVASIRKNGLARAKRVGTATITATYQSLSATATLTASSAKLVSLTLTPVNPSIAPRTKQQFVALGVFDDNSTQDMTAVAHWSSSSSSVATVSNSPGSDGLATSYATGNATIAASIGSVSGSTVLTVTGATLVSITVTPTNPSITLGSSQQFVATGAFSDSTSQDITNAVAWTSSNATVAVVSNTGLASSAGLGSSTIAATSSSVVGSTLLSVH